jgi:hypothetical protein
MTSVLILNIHITRVPGNRRELWKATVTYILTRPGFSNQLATHINLYLYGLKSYKADLKLLLRDFFRGYQIIYKGKGI